MHRGHLLPLFTGSSMSRAKEEATNNAVVLSHSERKFGKKWKHFIALLSRIFGVMPTNGFFTLFKKICS